jgi:hypothetical protein
MDVSAMANNVTQDNSTTSISAMKKAMDVEQNSVSKILQDSQQQMQQIQQQNQIQAQQQQQSAAKTGMGINLNIMA